MQVWIGLVTLLIGLGIMIGCAVPMSKEKDKTTPKYKGLIAGVVIGVLITVAGIFIMVSSGRKKNSSVVPVMANKKPANNPITAFVNQLETSGAVEAANAQKKLEAAQELNKVAGLIKV